MSSVRTSTLPSGSASISVGGRNRYGEKRYRSRRSDGDEEEEWENGHGIVRKRAKKGKKEKEEKKVEQEGEFIFPPKKYVLQNPATYEEVHAVFQPLGLMGLKWEQWSNDQKTQVIQMFQNRMYFSGDANSEGYVTYRYVQQQLTSWMEKDAKVSSASRYG
jgi:hypothetical protein